jgi:HSP20 family protein
MDREPMSKKQSHKTMVHPSKPDPNEELWREFGHAMVEMERRMERALRSVADAGSLPAGPLVHGVSLGPAPGGGLRFQSFGNLHESLEHVLEGWREPLVHVRLDEAARNVEVDVELPGLRREDLKLVANATMVHVEGQTGGCRYRVTCTPGVRMDSDRAHADFRDGLLKLRIPVAEGGGDRDIPVSE